MKLKTDDYPYLIEPIGHRVLIKPKPVEETSKGGIILNENKGLAEANQIEGTLIAVGPNAWKAFDDGEPWCEVGDKVLYARFSAKALICPKTEEKLVMCLDDDIIARLLEDE